MVRPIKQIRKRRDDTSGGGKGLPVCPCKHSHEGEHVTVQQNSFLRCS